LMEGLVEAHLHFIRLEFLTVGLGWAYNSHFPHLGGRKSNKVHSYSVSIFLNLQVARVTYV
jgi:NADH:ubiquinone oxidoreductase subunit H